VPAARLLLWQPVLSGAIYLQQFLRLSVAANLFGPGKSGVAVAPAQLLAAGRPVEVAGYEISPALADGLKAAELKLPAVSDGRAAWFEITSNAPDGGCSPAAVRSAEAMHARGWRTQLEAIEGAPFWQTTEIVENEHLLRRSLAALSAEPDRLTEQARNVG
jgi:exosortase A-associated hydrolase 2